MLKIFIISIGMVLVIEGIMYFLLHRRLNELMFFLKKLNPSVIKNFSFVMILSGICLIYFTLRYYGELE